MKLHDDMTSDGEDCDCGSCCCGSEAPIGLRTFSGVIAGGLIGFVVGGVPWLFLGLLAGLIIGGVADLDAYWSK